MFNVPLRGISSSLGKEASPLTFLWHPDCSVRRCLYYWLYCKFFSNCQIRSRLFSYSEAFLQMMSTIYWLYGHFYFGIELRLTLPCWYFYSNDFVENGKESRVPGPHTLKALTPSTPRFPPNPPAQSLKSPRSIVDGREKIILFRDGWISGNKLTSSWSVIFPATGGIQVRK